ncbi:MAG: hypothetical protein ACRDKT_08320 [Actinomycetota bacterium]
MNPGDTDQFKTVEELMHRLTQVPKKEEDEPEKAEPSKTDPSDKTPDAASEESEA